MSFEWGIHRIVTCEMREIRKKETVDILSKIRNQVTLGQLQENL